HKIFVPWNSLRLQFIDCQTFNRTRLRGSGEWASEISDPFTRKRIWLGTFNTVDEASDAYMAKKEFQARRMGLHVESRLKGSVGCEVGPMHWKKRWRGSVYDPDRKVDVDSDLEEEALKAFEAMKQERVKTEQFRGRAKLDSTPFVKSSSPCSQVVVKWRMAVGSADRYRTKSRTGQLPVITIYENNIMGIGREEGGPHEVLTCAEQKPLNPSAPTQASSSCNTMKPLSLRLRFRL
ncbi:hypothetical protein M8C21_017727, partial [Ambrosia artemisiifolia]